MKKNYVNLSVRVVDVQLSDCIAGSNGVQVKTGRSLNAEINAAGAGDNPGAITFGTW